MVLFSTGKGRTECYRARNVPAGEKKKQEYRVRDLRELKSASPDYWVENLYLHNISGVL